MKKYYCIYEIISKTKFGTVESEEKEVLKNKTFSEHSAVQWVSEHLSKEKYKENVYRIKPIYANE